MVNGKDYTMDSAFNMLDVIYDDLTILDVVSWQKWVAVADGDYRDGLIYINQEKKAFRDTKRLWAFGNLTKFVRPGFTRVEASNPYSNLYNMKTMAFTGVNEHGDKELVLVMINREEGKEFQLEMEGLHAYNEYEIYSTTEERNLEQIKKDSFTKDTVIEIEGSSITTIILTEKH